jgi:hypothetical protein
MKMVKRYHLLFDKQLIILKILVINLFVFLSLKEIDCLGLNEPGIFRRTASVSLIKQVQEKYNEGLIK